MISLTPHCSTIPFRFFFRHKNTSFNVIMRLQFGCEQNKRTENRFKVNHASVSNVVSVFFHVQKKKTVFVVCVYVLILHLLLFGFLFILCWRFWWIVEQIKGFTFIILALGRWNALLVLLHIRWCVSMTVAILPKGKPPSFHRGDALHVYKDSF